MRKALSVALVAGVLLAIGLYLFPVYIFQELFIDYLGEQSGGGYWSGVALAMVFSAAIIVIALFIMRPRAFMVLRNPYMAGAAIFVLVLAYMALSSLWGA